MDKWRKAVGVLLASVAIYVSGFLAESSYFSLLGVEIHDPSKISYLWASTEFAFAVVDAAAVVFSPGISWRWMLFMVVMLLLAVGAVALTVYRLKHPAKTSRRRLDLMVGLGFVMLLLLAKGLVLELPVREISDVLSIREFHEVAPPVATGVLQAQVNYFWRLGLCSRRITFWANVCESGSPSAFERLQILFFANVAATLSVVSVLLMLFAKSRRAVGLVALLIAFIAVAGLHTFYGRTLRSLTLTPEVAINYELDSDSIRGYLFERPGEMDGDGFVNLLVDDHRRFWRIPTSAISVVKGEGRVDTYRFAHAENGSFTGLEIETLENDIHVVYDMSEDRERTLRRREWQSERLQEGGAELVTVTYAMSGGKILRGFLLCETADDLFLFERETERMWKLRRDRAVFQRIDRQEDVITFHLNQVWGRSRG